MQILVCQIVECAELEGKTRRLSTRINEKRAAEAAGAEVTSEKEKTQASEKDSTRAEAKEKSWQVLDTKSLHFYPAACASFDLALCV